MIKIIDFHHFCVQKNASSIETINKHSILLAYICNMVEMRGVEPLSRSVAI